ncbi:MAG: prepilin-type cleavage/methylation domain-containing protein [Limisphaerales bacterium]
MDHNKVAEPAQKRKGKAWKVLLYATLLIIAVLAVIPYVVRARLTECKNACVNGLRQVEGAKEQVALELKLQKGAVITAAQIQPYLKAGSIPKCPEDGSISIGILGESPTCSQPGHALQISAL